MERLTKTKPHILWRRSDAPDHLDPFACWHPMSDWFVTGRTMRAAYENWRVAAQRAGWQVPD